MHDPRNNNYLMLNVFYEEYCMEKPATISLLLNSYSRDKIFECSKKLRRDIQTKEELLDYCDRVKKNVQRYGDFLSLLHFAMRAGDVKIYDQDCNIKRRGGREVRPPIDRLADAARCFSNNIYNEPLSGAGFMLAMQSCILDSILVKPVALINWMREHTDSREFLNPQLQVNEDIWKIDGLFENQVPISGHQPGSTEEDTTQIAQTPKKKNRGHGKISGKNAATILGVTERTIRTWESDHKKAPQDYPGRDDKTAFYMFANAYKQKKRLAEQARAMNRAVSGGVNPDSYGDHEDET